MSRETEEAVSALRVNKTFYAAIADGDLRAMDELWARDEPVLCIHPGSPPLQGRVAVMASWSEIFDGGAPPISYTEDSVSLIRGIAFVSCLEHIGAKTLSALNVLIWEDAQWRFVSHHAGLLTDPIGMLTPTDSSGAIH